jgi:hypothetical protein
MFTALRGFDARKGVATSVAKRRIDPVEPPCTFPAEIMPPRIIVHGPPAMLARARKDEIEHPLSPGFQAFSPG